MEPYCLFSAATCAVGLLLLKWRIEKLSHDRKLGLRRLRVHVNGIRGKSTVTRILAGILREAGHPTVAKTTGSAACVIDRLGVDRPIRRRGAPTILEQVEIVRQLDWDIDALVVECMAIKPEYQAICEEKIIRSHIGVITNVREDHQDVLGESLQEIASNLMATCPRNGILITAERNPRLLPLFREFTACRGTKLIVTDPDEVSDDELAAFPYVAFKENIAIGFEFARSCGIDRQTALRGMAGAAPDPGVLRIEKRTLKDQSLTWADLFAVNDRESVIQCVKKVKKLAPSGACSIGLLNNRYDREHRALQFARIASCDLELDFLVLMGAYQKPVEEELLRGGFPANRILRIECGNQQEGSRIVTSLLEQASRDNRMTPSHWLLIGLVNIHTTEAESLRDWFSANVA